MDTLSSQSPADLTATVYDALGIPPHTEIHDRLGRALPISSGKVLICLFEGRG